MAISLKRLAATGALAAVAAFGVAGVAAANTPSSPTSNSGIVPYIVDEPGPGGNVTCEQLGYEHSSARVNYNDGQFDADFPDGINVNTDGTYVSWTSTFGIGAVIVKGSDDANVYEYMPASYGDSGLASPVNASGNPAGLSNLTFCWGDPVQPQGLISGLKYYDGNLNGEYDAGESVIPGWKIDWSNGTSGVATTDANGLFQVPNLAADTYTFAEQLGGPFWVQTGNTVDQSDATTGSTVDPTNFVYEVNLAEDGIVTGLNFGNVCLTSGGGKTIGFWSNRNGLALFGSDDLAKMVALNLRDAGGGHFDPANYSAFRTWLLNATATNMSYMLSAQLAAMKLNVYNGLVDGSALIYAPGTNAANAAGFATVWAIIAEANSELGSHGLVLADSPYRDYQEALKDALDKANNNTNFLQTDPAACPAPVFPES